MFLEVHVQATVGKVARPGHLFGARVGAFTKVYVQLTAIGIYLYVIPGREVFHDK